MIDANKLMSKMSNASGDNGGYRTEKNGDEGFIQTPSIPDQDVSFDTILTRCGFDPDEYEIDGTPAVKRWEAQTPDGQTWMSSYGIKVRKRVVGLPEEDIEERIERLRSFTPALRKNRHGSGERVAAVVNLADFQAYKSEGGGIEGLTQRLTDGLENVQAWVDRCRSSYNVEEIILVNNGDAIEGCAGSYDSQLFTVSGTHRQQYNYALDAWDVYARNLFPQFEHRQFVSVLSNHGEMGRFGTSRNKTSDSDSADGFLAETLKRVYDSTDEFADVEWTIPHDQMNVYTQTRQGVKLALNHGHKIKGSDATAFEKWLSGQARGDRDAWEADIWITAHRHNFQAWDLGSCSAFQCPSMDGGSKWLRDMNGRYSNSGLLAFLVGQHSKTKWSDLAFL